MKSPSLSFLIPLYNSEETISSLIAEIAELPIEGGHEIVLVDDGSSDGTRELCRRLVLEAKVPITLVSHARNFGEHNAVLSGLRVAKGAYIVTLDDDGQNPPAEGKRLYDFARAHGLDAVFARHPEKQHSPWRNFTSFLHERFSDWTLDKPPGLYVSTFRCLSGWLAQELAKNSGPNPYVDGLILQITRRVGMLEVAHQRRAAGKSGYTLRKLVRLWIGTIVNFSILPLRLLTILGLMLSGVGVLIGGWTIYSLFSDSHSTIGQAFVLPIVFLLSGVQLVSLGLVGEYLGHLLQKVNQRPQSVVREIFRSESESASVGLIDSEKL